MGMDNLVVLASFIYEMDAQNGLLLLTCYPFQHIGPAPQHFLMVTEK